MYLDEYSFLGIGVQQGQNLSGLESSAAMALTELRTYLNFSECEMIESSKSKTPIHRRQDLKQLDWSIYNKSYCFIRKQHLAGNVCLNWGGDHSLGLSTVAAFTSLYSNGFVIWIDAHADLNTPESSATGSFHGMPLSFLMGIGEESEFVPKKFWDVLDPRHLIYIGLRDLDPYEKYLLKTLPITQITSAEIKDGGLPNFLAHVKAKIGQRPVHISFDIDSVEPNLAPSTGVPVTQGLEEEHLTELAGFFSNQAKVKSVDVAEINPSQGTFAEVKQTFEVAFRFVNELFHSKRRMDLCYNSFNNLNKPIAFDKRDSINFEPKSKSNLVWDHTS